MKVSIGTDRERDSPNKDGAKLDHNTFMQKEFNSERELNEDYHSNLSIDPQQSQNNQLTKNYKEYGSFDNRQNHRVSIVNEDKNVIGEMRPLSNRYEQINNEKYHMISTNSINHNGNNIDNRNIKGDHDMSNTMDINEESSSHQHLLRRIKDIPKSNNVILLIYSFQS